MPEAQPPKVLGDFELIRVPATVDPATGYRYYDESNLERARSVRMDYGGRNRGRSLARVRHPGVEGTIRLS